MIPLRHLLIQISAPMEAMRGDSQPNGKTDTEYGWPALVFTDRFCADIGMTAASKFQAGEPKTLLVIGGSAAESAQVAEMAQGAGWETLICSELEQAIRLLDRLDVAAAVLSGERNASAACETIAYLRSNALQLPIFVIAGATSPDWTLKMKRAGATDYLAKSSARERLPDLLHRELEKGRPASEPTRDEGAERFTSAGSATFMIGNDPELRTAIAQAAFSARGYENILLEGEPGTGKYAIARAIHAASRRRAMPAKTVDVQQFGEAELESILFGHERGAFVGAFQSQPGVLQQCGGGTLIIDGIDLLPRAIQHRLADALVRRRVHPIGAANSVEADTRVIGLSAENVTDLVGEGFVAPALVECLAGAKIKMPPLRDRRDDIPLIAEHVLGTITDAFNLGPLVLHKDAVTWLKARDWDANVRDLEFVLFRAAATCRSDAITVDTLAAVTGPAPTHESFDLSSSAFKSTGMQLFGRDGHMRALIDVETEIIRVALDRYAGCMTEIARRLGIGRSTLYRKVRELDEQP